MSVSKQRPAATRWYRTPTARGFSDSEIQVDRETGVLRGFIAMETGVARGHGEEVDGKTLDSIVELTAGRKVKMRFGHPSMSDDALGTTAGRAFNFRRDGDRVIGDAQLLRAADSSPKGQIRTHLLDLAEEAPDMFGTSFVIKRELEERLDEKGEPIREADGRQVPPLIRPTAVLASDFVDSPAATSALFSETNAILSAEASEVLETVLSRPDAADRLRAFVDRYEADHPGAADLLRAALGPQPEEAMSLPNHDELEPVAELTHDEMVERLRASGYSIGPPSPPDDVAPPEAKDAPGDSAVLAQLAAIRQELSEEKAARQAAEEKAAKANRTQELAEYRRRLEALTHVDASRRDRALKLAEAALELGHPETADDLVAQLEELPDLLSAAKLERQISVPLGENEVQVDLSRYEVLIRDGDGLPQKALLGDADYMANAAAISTIEDPEKRREARMKLWAEHRQTGGAA